MRSDRNSALKLRLKGRSYNEISRLLNIPKSTLSSWFTRLEISRTAQDRLRNRAYNLGVAALIKRNHSQTFIAQQRASDIHRAARKEVENISHRDLFVIGISLYWAEGYKRPIVKNGKVKTSHPVTLSNADPRLAKMFTEFLLKICRVPSEKIHGEVRVYEHQNPDHLLHFWSKTTDIPINRLKVIRNGISISSKRMRPYNILPYGTIQIRVNSTELYHKIMGWIEGLSEACFP